MASKKELIQAQSFARRRLLTAFTSGIPGGKELEPTTPLRAVMTGIALSVLVIAASFGSRLFSSAPKEGWDNNQIVIDNKTGARYLTNDGIAYPILNMASAQLILSDPTQPLFLPTATIATAKLGSPIGIPGAPDLLPDPKNLIPSGWSSCVNPPSDTDEPAEATRLDAAAASTAPTEDAIVVTHSGTLYVIWHSHRYPIEEGREVSVLGALGLDSMRPIPVSSRWLNLFEAGSALGPPVIDHAGDELPRTLVVDAKEPLVGSVVQLAGVRDQRYVLTADGTKTRMSDLAFALYQIDNDPDLSEPVPVTLDQIKGFATNPDTTVGPSDWPEFIPSVWTTETMPCALLTTTNGKPGVALATPKGEPAPSVITVTPGHGALVRAVAHGDPGGGSVYLIDQTGTAFPIPNPSDDILGRLGYTADNVARVPTAWLLLFPLGPALDENKAREPAAEYQPALPAAPQWPSTSPTPSASPESAAPEQATPEQSEDNPPAAEQPAGQ